MYQQLKYRLRHITKSKAHYLLKDCLVGLEKESLRVTLDGHLSQKKHPKILGSALTHPWITTDYAESMLELITPPCSRSKDSLQFLLDLETFIYQQLDNEILWTTSMPCVLQGEKDIRIAEYGSSNLGKMKHIYRHGLAWRYGKMMQVISGIHFNYSIATDFWSVFQKLEKNKAPKQTFINQQYMGMIRNIQRFGWLIPYLFGTSPAICQSFLKGVSKPENMQALNDTTYYEPGGTSLRMGDIGYTNHQEHKIGIRANYDSVENYVKSLRHAISTSCPTYEKIGVQVDGKYRQLNSNILQMENEYYSTVRPKQVLQSTERPIDALQNRGIQYVELRSLDINAFRPAGLTQNQLHFLEIFMLFCFLQESPLIDKNEQKEIDKNQSLVAHQGRIKNLALQRFGEKITLRNWATEIMQEMSPIAGLLGSIHQDDCYQDALDHQMQLAFNANLTPSAKMLQEMRDNEECFFSFAQRKSLEHQQHFQQQTLDPARLKAFQAMTETSHQQQKALESQLDFSFEQFLLNL